jgi:hypothetical protein
MINGNYLAGAIVALIGLSMILFKKMWLKIGEIAGTTFAATNNWRYRMFRKQITFTGVDPRYIPSAKGMNIVGIIFIILGIIVAFLF